ncbi:DUF1129 domain-containing protein [Marinilactibacillus psychrotolerans]|uniref:DUF1129 domain-containing protein n=2 Tax=Marinilactibacillus psychrotolerans TaxID=191770 RepID=A0ABW8US10_9LACT|nr:DUF1129 family protein [Marinilactibacillus psychrotolerans]SJN45464.1 hypothetical protein FM115_11125 [Marinilactibacillus psychrotolerans 42ea]
MTKTQEMIKQNNELREQLNTENKAYYEEILIYMRLRNWLKDEEDIESKLLEILQDIISAQEDGMSAKEYFGQEPKEIADEILSNVPINWLDGLKILGLVFGISIFFSILSDLSADQYKFNLLQLIVHSVTIGAGVIICLSILKKSTFEKEKSSSKLEILLFGATFAGTIGILLASSYFISDAWTIALPKEIALVVTTLAALGVTWKVFILPKGERLLWSSFLPIIWLFVLLAFLNYFPASSDWIQSSNGKVVVVTGVILGLIINYLIGFYAIKKMDVD